MKSSNKWLDHVRSVKEQHKDKTYKDILVIAKASYNNKNGDDKNVSVVVDKKEPEIVDVEPKGSMLADARVIEGGAIIERKFNDQAEKILKDFGDAQIISIEVRRAPVQAAVEGLLNIVSFGAYEKAVKNSPYDKMFHLSSVLTLNKNGAIKKVILEKNEVVNLSSKINVEKDTEVMQVTIPTPFKNLKSFIDATMTQIGSGAFFLYDAQNRNCQRFIADNLRANGVLTPELDKFIVQDAKSIFDRMPKFVHKFSRALTDLGAAASHAKDEIVDTVQDVSKATKIATKATVKTAKRVGKKIKKAFGGAIEIDEKPKEYSLHSILVPRSVGLREAKRIVEEHGLNGSDRKTKKEFYEFIQMPKEQFDKKSLNMRKLEENNDLIVNLGYLI
jgi:hypothetical protein